jgi:hypothetical protein
MVLPKNRLFVSRLSEQGPGQGKTRRLHGFPAPPHFQAAKTSGTLRDTGANPALMLNKN